MPADKRLVKDLKNHKQNAFEIIYETYNKLVFYVVYSIVNNVEITEELVQDTFLKMWININKYNNNNFKAWLITIAKNLTKDYLRTNKKCDQLNVDYVEDKCANYLLNEFNIDAKFILNNLEYNVITLTIVYNLKRREVAEVLEKPLGTITRVYCDAVKKLKIFYNK